MLPHVYAFHTEHCDGLIKFVEVVMYLIDPTNEFGGTIVHIII
jgi:hypothetical protein